MLRFPGNKTFVRNVLHYAHTGVGDVGGDGKLVIVVGTFEQVGAYGNGGDSTSKLKAVLDAFHDFERERSAARARVPVRGVRRGGARALGVRAREPRAPRGDAALREGHPARRAGRRRGARGGHRGARDDARARRARDQDVRSRRSCAPRSTTEHAPAPDEMVRRAREARLVSDATGRELRTLLAYMGRVETLVLSRRAEAMRQVRDADVVRCATQARAISAEIRARKNAA